VLDSFSRLKPRNYNNSGSIYYMATKSTYHKTDEMGAFSGTKFYTTNQDLKESDKVYVISSKGKDAQLVPYLEGSFRVEKSTQGDFRIGSGNYKYESALDAVIKPEKPININSIRLRLGKRVFASRFMNMAKPVLESDEIETFDSLLSSTSRKALEFESSVDELSNDIGEILQSNTEQAQNVLARIGQGKFRKNVVSVWGGGQEICALTGIALPEILTASHIIPWSDCIGEHAHQRWDGANGVLLCSHIDRLFDRYLLSFKRKGQSCSIQYSHFLSDDILRQLSLTNDLELVPNRMSVADKIQFFGYMEVHYNKFIARESKKNLY